MHDDCPNPEIVLHKNKIGCVIQCAHCGDLLVKVENILYSCNMKSYNSLFNIINYVESNLEDHMVEIMKEKYVLNAIQLKYISIIQLVLLKLHHAIGI